MRRALALVVCAAFVGCVTSTQHEAVLDERESLREQAERLRASVAAIEAERDQIAAELEDLRQSNESAAREAEQRRGDCETRLAEHDAKLAELDRTYEGLIRDLEAQLATGNSEIEQLRDGLRTRLPAEVLFESGSAELSDAGEGVLAGMAENLRREDYASYQILVEGHTDGVAVRGALAQRYPTNWELAGARAASVVRALEAAGVPAARLAAVSRGAEQPIAENESPEGRSANRRIEIRLIPLPGAKPSVAPPPLRAPDADAAPPEAPPAP
jgi:chemotaxis protein MotB